MCIDHDDRVAATRTLSIYDSTLKTRSLEYSFITNTFSGDKKKVTVYRKIFKKTSQANVINPKYLDVYRYDHAWVALYTFYVIEMKGPQNVRYIRHRRGLYMIILGDA